MAESLTNNTIKINGNIIEIPKGIQSVCVAQNSVEIASFYSNQDPKTLFPQYSITKSFISIAAGILIDEGKLSLNSKLMDYIKPDEIPQDLSDLQKNLLNSLTLKDLLTMRFGHDKGMLFEAERKQLSLPNSESFLSYALHLPLSDSGMHKFVYSNVNAYLVSIVLERVLLPHETTSKTSNILVEFLQKRLFDPLGIKSDDWKYEIDIQGHFFGSSGLYISSENLLKVGIMLQQGGIYEGKRIVSEKYIKEATSVQVVNKGHAPTGGNSEYEACYGYFFWCFDNKDCFCCLAKNGQICAIFQDVCAVVVVNSNTQGSTVSQKFVFEDIYKALKGKS